MLLYQLLPCLSTGHLLNMLVIAPAFDSVTLSPHPVSPRIDICNGGSPFTVRSAYTRLSTGGYALAANDAAISTVLYLVCSTRPYVKPVTSGVAATNLGCGLIRIGYDDVFVVFLADKLARSRDEPTSTVLMTVV
jgi:hypothetical protein